MAYTVDEFAQKIKTKYPEYSQMDNAELSRRIVDKHPEYASQVTFDTVETPQEAPQVTPQDTQQENAPVIKAGVKKTVQFDPMYQPV